MQVGSNLPKPLISTCLLHSQPTCLWKQRVHNPHRKQTPCRLVSGSGFKFKAKLTGDLFLVLVTEMHLVCVSRSHYFLLYWKDLKTCRTCLCQEKIMHSVESIYEREREKGIFLIYTFFIKYWKFLYWEKLVHFSSLIYVKKYVSSNNKII